MLMENSMFYGDTVFLIVDEKSRAMIEGECTWGFSLSLFRLSNNVEKSGVLNSRWFTLPLRMAGSGSSTNIFRATNECNIPLEVLDFIKDFSQPDLEVIWPCQARSYWLTLQPFVKFVRILLNYVTPFIIVIGKGNFLKL